MIRATVRLLVKEATNVSRLLALRGSGVAATFLMSFLIVRRFGAEANGLFQVGLSYVMIGAAIARLGQEQLALRDIAAHKAHDSGGDARRAIDLSLAVTLPAGLLVTVAFAGITLWDRTEGGGITIALFAPAILFLAWLWIETEALRGWQRVGSAVFWQGSFVPIAFVIGVVALDTVGLLGARHLPLLYTTATALALLGAHWSWRHAVRQGDGPSPLPLSLSAAWATVERGSTFWILAILTNVAGWLDLLVLYAFADAQVVGIFQPIIRTGGLIAVAINIATAGLVARLALLFAARAFAQFVALVRLYWLAITLASLLVGIGFLLFAPVIAAAWGPAIAPYHREFSLYVLIQLFQAVFIIAPLTAPVIGLERAMVTVQIANVPMKAIAVFIGYSQGGLTGVIVGLGFCTVVSVLWTVLLFFRQLHSMEIRWQSFLTGQL